ncbi:MAG TPA: hypothetical protein VIL86_18610 [Tepidisphaeraceae bacterium]
MIRSAQGNIGALDGWLSVAQHVQEARLPATNIAPTALPPAPQSEPAPAAPAQAKTYNRTGHVVRSADAVLGLLLNVLDSAR